ncbi:methyltransferase domain-containing protein [Telmatocola sphagniphila]|uniref:Methyltransferase domain-containing protein n=1 Tax=Telmatocola sphagniphila TaxID=1123043 RepID=A0A8E6EWQ6_9BACT|nr:methyltransferase [Telmatocola sphagniphila]QVL34210.1 methyltransferase domain-containing protein [Telmatocola sphagniphila]
MSVQSPSPRLFFEAVSAYEKTEAIRTAVELELFTHIASGKRTPPEIAQACQACQASPRGIRILCDYLTVQGFLIKHNDRYELTADSSFYLDKNSPAYLGKTLEFLHTPKLRECFHRLTEAVRIGGTALPEEGTVSHDNPIWVEFARGMVGMMRLPAKLLADLVKEDTNKPLRILDVAAGHGIFGITIAERYPQARVTALDWRNVLAVASENASQAGISQRYSLLPGSAFDVDWGGPYDLVLLTNFFHHFDVPTCEKLAAKAYAALAPGGRALTLDFIPEADRISPAHAAGFALTMLVATGHGDAYTFEEYRKLFEKAGFAKNEFHALLPTNQQAIVSSKA